MRTFADTPIAEASLDLVGNIRLGSARRLRYLLATLDSLAFMANRIGLYLNIENGRHLLSPLSRRLRHLGFHVHYLSCETADYGDVYCRLLARSTAAFVLHLEEDHFCVLDDWTPMDRIIRVASAHNVDAAVMTFHPWIDRVLAQAPWEYEDPLVRILVHDRTVFAEHVARHGGFYLGNNMMFRRAFALRYWGRDLKARTPHAYELRTWQADFEYRLLVPKIEILRAIDDDHGVPGSCCLARPAGKWARVDAALRTGDFAYWIASDRAMRLARYATSRARAFLNRARDRVF